MNTTASPDPGAAVRGRLQLLLLAALFFLPLIASFVLYFGFPGLRPSGTTNYGELMNPARPTPDLRFLDATGKPVGTDVLHGRWSLVTIAGGSCDAACAERLLMTRQVRTAMNEKRSRVQRLLVIAGDGDPAAVTAALSAEHPDLKVLAEGGTTGKRLRDFLEGREATMFLLDPHGNWVLFYPPGRAMQADFKGMQKDLRKLLRLSQIG